MPSPVLAAIDNDVPQLTLYGELVGCWTLMTHGARAAPHVPEKRIRNKALARHHLPAVAGKASRALFAVSLTIDQA